MELIKQKQTAYSNLYGWQLNRSSEKKVDGKGHTQNSVALFLWVFNNFRTDFVCFYIALLRSLENETTKPERYDMDKEEIITSLTEHRVKQDILIKSVEKLTLVKCRGFSSYVAFLPAAINKSHSQRGLK